MDDLIDKAYLTAQDAALAYDIEVFARQGEAAPLYQNKTITANDYRSRTRAKYRGVTFHNQKWLAQICYKRKPKCLGYFQTPEEAAKAYDAAAKERGFPPAKLNFPN